MEFALKADVHLTKKITDNGYAILLSKYPKPSRSASEVIVEFFFVRAS
jgi:hypothetical protein